MDGDEAETDRPRLVGISGSLRVGSANAKLLSEAVRAFGPCDFARGDIRLPLYDADLESEGMPDAVTALADLVRGADAVVIATPEYNKNLPGGLKNALDWLSRTKPAPLAGKPVAIVSAASGVSGGARSQYSLRHCLTPFDSRVLNAPEVMIAGGDAAFDADGRLKDLKSVALLTALMAKLRAEIARVRS